MGALALVQSLFSLQATPHRYEWLLFAALALLTGSFSMKVGSVYGQHHGLRYVLHHDGAAVWSRARDRCAIAFGTVVVLVARGKHSLSASSSTPSNSAFSMWAGSHVFFWLSGVPPLTHSQSPVAQLIVPLLALTAVHYLINSGLIAVAIGLDARQVAVCRLARTLPVALGELFRSRVGLVLPRAADVSGEPRARRSSCCRCSWCCT